MDPRNGKTYYILSQEDAYRIDGLISMLGLAISEIIEEKNVTYGSLDPDDDDYSAVEVFENEASDLLGPPF